jgi:uncharacterized protein (DUF1330 family)
MKPQVKLAVAIIAGVGIGAATVEGLHAQAKKTAIYAVAEIDVTNLDAYQKEYAPKAQGLIKKSGGKLLAASQNVASYEGAPPAKRVAIQLWESKEQYVAYRNSAEFKENRKIGDKYAKFRSYTVEALP